MSLKLTTIVIGNVYQYYIREESTNNVVQVIWRFQNKLGLSALPQIPQPHPKWDTTDAWTVTPIRFCTPIDGGVEHPALPTGLQCFRPVIIPWLVDDGEEHEAVIYAKYMADVVKRVECFNPWQTGETADVQAFQAKTGMRITGYRPTGDGTLAEVHLIDHIGPGLPPGMRRGYAAVDQGSRSNSPMSYDQDRSRYDVGINCDWP